MEQNFSMIKAIAGVLFMIVFLVAPHHKAAAQTISGPNAVVVNSTYRYSYTTTVVAEYRFLLTNGTSVATGQTGTTYWVDVKWSTIGTGVVKIEMFDTSGGKNEAKWVVKTQRTVTINDCDHPGQPTIHVASRCGPGQVTLSCTPSSTNGGNNIRWYGGLSSTLILATSTSFTTPDLSVSTAYFATTVNTETGCESSRRTVLATVNPIPEAPNAGSFTQCGPGVSSLNPTPGANGNSIEWYGDAARQALMHTGVPYSTTLSATKVFYIDSYNSTTGCRSSEVSTYTAFYDPTPPTATVSVSGIYRFGPGQFTLQASGKPDGTNYDWRLPNGVSFMGSTYMTGTVSESESGLLTVKVIDQFNCPGPLTPVDVYVYPYPQIEATGDRIVMNAPVGMKTTSQIYETYTWKKDDGVFSSASDIQTTKTGTYTVTVTKTGISATSLPFTLLGQFDGLNKNYIITNSVQTAGVKEVADISQLTVESNSQNIQYFDGLGRPIQTTETQSSPSRHDAVQPASYDMFGRQSIQYLPYVSSRRDGWYEDGAVSTTTGSYYGSPQQQFYDNGKLDNIQDDPAPYASTVFESSPFNRTLKQGAQGLAWQPNDISTEDRSKKIAYDNNKANEVLFFVYDSNGKRPVLKESTYYPINQLSVIRTLDEHNYVVIEYVDKDNKTILKRAQAEMEDGKIRYAETYYVYDAFGNIVAVLQPQMIEELKRSLSIE